MPFFKAWGLDSGSWIPRLHLLFLIERVKTLAHFSVLSEKDRKIAGALPKRPEWKTKIPPASCPFWPGKPAKVLMELEQEVTTGMKQHKSQGNNEM